MSKRSGGGYRASKNFEPSRGKSTGKSRLRGAAPTPGRASAAGKQNSETARHADTKSTSGRGNTAPQNPRNSDAKAHTASKAQGATKSTNRRGPKYVDGPKEVNYRGALPLPELPPIPIAPLTATRTAPGETTGTTFAQLGLGNNIIRALAEQGVEQPFAIQAVTIPDILSGHHVLGRGRTGSGKTIAFGAALVERLLILKRDGAFASDAPRTKHQRGVQADRERAQVRAPKALILAPTRELALQIDRTVQPIARSVGFYTGQFVGGTAFDAQLHALRRGIDIVIGTPGRIEDLMMRGHLNLSQVAITVIDEADHMSELGFIEPVQRLLRATRKRSQRLMFSATLDDRVESLVAEFMPRPAIHEVVDEGTTASENSQAGAGAQVNGRGDGRGDVRHHILLTMYEDKATVLQQLIEADLRTVVFTRTKAYAEMLTEQFTEAGIRAVPLHGDLSQIRRERNLAKFTDGKARVLVATDVAARGIHVDDVELVLQADPPDDHKTYVHRAGRTGRVGRSGTVITVIPRTRQKRTRELLEAAGITPDTFAGFAPGDAFPTPGGTPVLDGSDPIEGVAQVTNQIVD